jgi:hypothetical protein
MQQSKTNLNSNYHKTNIKFQNPTNIENIVVNKIKQKKKIIAKKIPPETIFITVFV